MSLFGAAVGDFDDDPFFGSHMRQMRHANQMMNSLFANPFGMGMMPDMGGPLSIMGAHPHTSMMPFMPQMNMNRLMTGGLHNGLMNGMGNSYSSIVVTSNGPDGRPLADQTYCTSQYSSGIPQVKTASRYNHLVDRTIMNVHDTPRYDWVYPDATPSHIVYSSTSSTQLGPDGVKETRRTVQDSRTGTKKMSIGHHIHDRAHLIEREQNVRSGDLEERQEFINIEEEEADEFNREFEERSRANRNVPSGQILPRSTPLLALTAPPTSNRRPQSRSNIGPRRGYRPLSSSPLALSSGPSSSAGAGVRHTYSSLHPQRSKQRSHKSHHNSSDY